MTRLGFLLATLLLQTVVSQNTTAFIDGMVVHDSTGKPVANASVELTVVEGARVVSRTTTSGEDGRFSFRDLPPAEGYQIVVTGSGLWPTAYGQERSHGPWTPIKLSPGQHLTDVRIAAQGITQISGKILDPSGKPQVGASVLAMRPTYVDGRRNLQRAGNTVTNLQGEYRFTNLNPGRYYIRVTPRTEGLSDSLFTNPSLRDRSASTSSTNAISEVEGYPTVYYPGVPVESAKVILLGDSQVINGLDIVVMKTGTSRVRGTITNSASGKKVAAAQVLLLPVAGSPDSHWGRFFDSRDGTFDLRAVLPGMYFLSATAMGTDRPLAGRVVVEIRSKETRAFDIPVSAGTDISGRIVLDNQNETRADFSTVSVGLAPDASQPIDGTLSRFRNHLPSASTAAKADGTFTLSGVMPWDYHVTVSGIPGAYVKAVRYGNMDVLSSGLRVDGSNSQQMEIVLATDGGRLDGRNLGVSNAVIVLVPEARSRRDLYLAASSSNTGRFQLTNIPPGRYKVFAWQNPADGVWTDPDYLERYESLGVPLDIQSESSEYIELRVIP